MILEIDAGNTRAKWRLRRSSADERSGVLLELHIVDAVPDAGATANLLYASLARIPWKHVEKIWVCNVRGGDFEDALTKRLQSATQVRAVFPKAVKHCAGVTNGYNEPVKLGIDRWLAILAAYSSVKQQCCVVDCGTTITVDLVADSGLHLGGYIVPGVALMKSSLSMRSVVLQSDVRSDISTAPGHTTSTAINNGVFAVISGFIKRVLADDSLGDRPTALFISGGDGQAVKSVLAQPSIYQSSLVLDGLQLACADPPLSRSWE